ncbi:DUF2919 domain-containing protein [Parashewanella spongiae]|uniref:DUF2919 domain-containing protein n=1 Tax=Parashewanella spongiae TaxID=342950 RepID=A0A3A6TG69_9GAMM|nr:DUF2919 domain-containing protein [Parashewanella spongiae]MCL1079781.1 DUF2919 domain-containing protein [Parashewanella spongiae]RJY06495.1 DUF2919 domain-containing protein [Parashewanella spongiae]
MSFSNIRWLDDKGRIKPPLFLYLILIFLARGWCVFILSLTQAGQRDGLVKLFYPLKDDFIASIIVGSIGLGIYFLVTVERRGKPLWLIPVFSKLKLLLFASVSTEFALIVIRLSHIDYQFSWIYAIEILILFWGIIYLLKSKHLKYYSQGWTIDRDKKTE